MKIPHTCIMVTLNYNNLSQALVEITSQASAAVRKIQVEGMNSRYKKDRSVVTDGDLASESIILPLLQKLTPHIPVISEEAFAANPRMHVPRTLWLVDPIDGTSSYARGNSTYAICIALIEQGRATLGAIAGPAYDSVHVGIVPDKQAWMTIGQQSPMPIRVNKVDLSHVVAVHGNSSLPTKLINCDHITNISMSSAIKFCMVADGRADVYARLSRLNEYDIAAGDALIHAAGGTMTTLNKQMITYGNPGLLSSAFIAQGSY